MSNQARIKKIKQELGKLTDIDRMKKELERITNELRKFNLNIHLSTNAKQRIVVLEKKYDEVVKAITRLQKQVDKEITHVTNAFQKSRADLRVTINKLVKGAEGHKKKIRTALKKKTKTKAKKKSKTTKKKTTTKKVTKKKA